MNVTPATFPTTIRGVALAAARSYLARWPLYLGLQLAAFVCAGIAQLIKPDDIPLGFTVSAIVYAYVIGAVSIGTLADAAGAPLSRSELFDRTTARWWAMAALNAVLDLLVTSTLGDVFHAGADNGFGLFGVLEVALWVAVGLATVVAAFEGRITGWRVLFFAMGRGGALAFTPRNLSRTAILALVTLLPIAVELVLAKRLTVLHIAHADFWASTPIDALVAGPLQALYAVFSLDMARRIVEPPRR